MPRNAAAFHPVTDPRPRGGPGAIPNTAPEVVVTNHKINDLRDDPRNPRVHSKRQIRQIARSIEAFGFNVPVLIDRDSTLIAGHGRVAACRLLGWTEVPTIRLDHLAPAQAQAFMIADNRLTENASWDDALLAQSLKDLSELDLDFALDVTGFEMGEIDLRIEQLDAGGDTEDAIEPPRPDPTPLASPGPATCGHWGTIACCAATPSLPLTI